MSDQPLEVNRFALEGHGLGHLTGNAPPRRLRPLLGRQGAPALDIGLPGSHGQELTASGRKRQGSAGYQPQVSKANRFEGSNGKGQWGRSRTFYISSLSRSPSLGNHRTHFSNVRTNPQTLPTWRHFGNALQPRKRPPVLGPSFASRSTRGLPHRGQILRSGPCGTCWSGNGIAVRFQSVESVQSVDPTAFSRSRLRLAVSMQ